MLSQDALTAGTLLSLTPSTMNAGTLLSGVPFYGPGWSRPMRDEVVTMVVWTGQIEVTTEIANECSSTVKMYYITTECCGSEAYVFVTTRIGKKRYTHTFRREFFPNPNVLVGMPSDDPCSVTTGDISPSLQAMESFGITQLRYVTACIREVPPPCGDGWFQSAVTPHTVYSRIHPSSSVEDLLPDEYGRVVVSGDILDAQYTSLPYWQFELEPCNDVPPIVPLRAVLSQGVSLTGVAIRGTWTFRAINDGNTITYPGWVYTETRSSMGFELYPGSDSYNAGLLAYTPPNGNNTRMLYPGVNRGCAITRFNSPFGEELYYEYGLGIAPGLGYSQVSALRPLATGIIADGVRGYENPGFAGCQPYGGNSSRIIGQRIAQVVEYTKETRVCPDDEGECTTTTEVFRSADLQSFAPPDLLPSPQQQCYYRVTLDFVGTAQVAIPLGPIRASLEAEVPLGQTSFVVPGPCGAPVTLTSYALGLGANAVIDLGIGLVTKLLPFPFNAMASNLDADVNVTITPL